MIKVLDQNTINKIAAGEVIEKPSSVIKELVENSIDSGATAVTVEVKGGGLSFLRVTDNGAGIKKDEVKLAFLRHATSKLVTVEDLLSISSLGFRGEALASIAAVAQVVDIIGISCAVFQMHVVVDRCKNIFFCDVLRNQIMKISLDQSLHLIYITCRFFNDSCKNRIIYLLCHANLGRININNSLEVNHHIGKDLDISGSLFTLYPDVRYCRILDHISDLTSNLCSLFSNNFTCDCTYSILSEDLS